MSKEELKRENEALKATNRKLENQVKEMESQLKLMQTIFDSLSEGVVATNLEGEFLAANPVAQNIVGMGPSDGDDRAEERSEIYGTFYPDRVTQMPSTELPLYKAIHGEISNEVEIFVRNPNQPDGVFISVNGRPLYDETGGLIGGCCHFPRCHPAEEIPGATGNNRQRFTDAEQFDGCDFQ